MHPLRKAGGRRRKKNERTAKIEKTNVNKPQQTSSGHHAFAAVPGTL